MQQNNKHSKGPVNYPIRTVPVDFNPKKSIWDHVNEALHFQDFGRFPQKVTPAQYIQFAIIKGLRDYEDPEKTEECLQILRELQGHKKKCIQRRLDFTIDDLKKEQVFNQSFWECRNSRILKRYGEKLIKINYLSYRFGQLCMGHRYKPKLNNWTSIRNHNFFSLCLFLFGATGKIEFVNGWRNWFNGFTNISSQIVKPILEEPEESPQLKLDFLPGTTTRIFPASASVLQNFFQLYKGIYNAIFIEDDDGSGKMTYGVSNVIIDQDNFSLFWQSEVYLELYYSRLKLLADDSTASTFLVRELNSIWGYMMMFETKPYVDQFGGFTLKYYGLKETNRKGFQGKVYFMKVKSVADLILPVRRKDLPDTESLLLGGNPEKVFRISNKLNESQPAIVTYKQLLEKALTLHSNTVNRINEIIRKLRDGGVPLE